MSILASGSSRHVVISFVPKFGKSWAILMFLLVA